MSGSFFALPNRYACLRLAARQCGEALPRRVIFIILGAVPSVAGIKERRSRNKEAEPHHTGARQAAGVGSVLQVTRQLPNKS
jgi:ABC-type enterochelin transport system permease subunit